MKIQKVFYGNQPVKHAYLNGKRVLNFAPIAVADFVNQVYELNGNTSVFSDVFDFRRAGKAWLVKDSALQEYAEDVPRFSSDGVVIEEAVTNRFLNNLTLHKFADNEYCKKDILDDAVFGKAVQLTALQDRDTSNTAGIVGYPFEPYLTVGSLRVIYIKKGYAKYVGVSVRAGARGFFVDTENGVIADYNYADEYRPKLTAFGDWYKVSWLINGSGYNNSQFDIGFGHTITNGGTNHRLGANAGDSCVIACPLMFYETNSTRDSTPIVSDSAEVTRPADFLNLNNNIIGGSYISGDWDDTLQLSIVDGQLVHSGYGQIRRLEIYQ